MRAAHDAVTIPASIANQNHRQPVQADIVTDLFKRSSEHKRSDAVDPWTQSLTRQSGRNGDHVLFGDAGIDESWTQRIPQWLQRAISQIAREENQFAAMLFAEKSVSKCLSHASSTSRQACSYCCVVMGR